MHNCAGDIYRTDTDKVGKWEGKFTFRDFHVWQNIFDTSNSRLSSYTKTIELETPSSNHPDERLPLRV